MYKPNEDTVEIACKQWFEDIGYISMRGEETTDQRLRGKYSEIILSSILKNKLQELNPEIPSSLVDEIIVKLNSLNSLDINKNNQEFHKWLIGGIPINYYQGNKEENKLIKLIDFINFGNNEFRVVNQFTVTTSTERKRPDLVIFLNGLPIGVIELKNMLGEDTDILSAYNQLQTYKNKIPDLFIFNELMVISDGYKARIGSLTAKFDRFVPWRTIDGKKEADKLYFELEVLIKGLFNKSYLLDLIKNFITYKETDDSVEKVIAMYHQIGAVNKAIDRTLEAIRNKRGKAGVIWHTQGSGKSYSMLFFANKIRKVTELSNPTIVVLTDRNDLDNQIYNNFLTSPDLVSGVERADSVADLEDLLDRDAGGIIFSTMQKFRNDEYSQGKFSKVNKRKNIVVVADEAHRTQYGTKQGFARNVRLALPNATFIGFTGTPIDFEGRSTVTVFGDLIDIYDIEQSIQDRSTVRIYYDARLAKLDLVNHNIDEEYEEINENVEEHIKQEGKSKWANLEKVVGTKKRLEKIGNDIVRDFNDRGVEGKAMVVAMSRRIAVDLYNIMKSLPEAPQMTVVITTSSSDGPEYDEFKRNKTQQREVEKKFKDPKDSLKIVIVRDMWLTGFDIPCLHTMYIDKPMKDHNLMQAIARVNRVFKDKEGGLVVDYIGIAEDIKKASAYYTKKGIPKSVALDIDNIMGLLKDKLEILREFFKRFDISGWLNKEEKDQLYFIKHGADHLIEGGDESKKNFLKESKVMIKLLALLPYSEEIENIREERIFYESVRKLLVKNSFGAREKSVKETAIKQLINESISSDEVFDIFDETNSDRPNISKLTEDVLRKIERIEFKNLQIEILRKIINDEIKIRLRLNMYRYKNLKDLLEKTIKRYHNRSLTSAQIFDELVKIAEEMMEEEKNHIKLGMSDEEYAFYSLLKDKDTERMDDAKLKKIVVAVIKSIKNNLTIDWFIRENVKSSIRSDVRRVLRRNGFLDDKQQNQLVEDVMLQAEGLWQDYIAA